MRQILVTSALPYANGQIHMGHLFECIQADIWVRFQRMKKNEIYYISADDSHGTPIMLQSEKESLSPEELISYIKKEHERDLSNFFISFDNYYSTHGKENFILTNDIYLSLYKLGLIEKRTIKQAYDPIKKMFLPDRFLKGDCPICQAKNQYGDSCEQCGSFYSSTELKNPISVISGAVPIIKKSDHYFFKLTDPQCKEFLQEWTKNTVVLQEEVKNKIKEWIDESSKNKLKDWNISRDAPYFGFEIPNTIKKYFYVWFDAPICYYASFKHLCIKKEINFDEWVNPNTKTEMHHFIGKDILYFHTLFWPAMLKFSGYRTPTKIFSHGFLTINGKKMSKSRGTFITANKLISSGCNPEWFRYYFAARTNGTIEDIDLNLKDLISKVNSDLLGKYINIASRSAHILVKYFFGKISNVIENQLLIDLRSENVNISNFYEKCEYTKVIHCVMKLANTVNIFIDSSKFWEKVKISKKDPKLQEICSIALEAFRILSLYLKPIIPKVVENAEHFLNISSMNWDDIKNPLPENHLIRSYSYLMQRVDPQLINTLITRE